ncbi:hypothetical protein EK904_007674 [Melospiza melodia maxima]|nr:hypothetical protein EK904_007674 [Melospiza melodia maxima]
MLKVHPPKSVSYPYKELKVLKNGSTYLQVSGWKFGVFPVRSRFTEAAVTCPDREPELEVWNPGHNEENRVEIRNGRKVLLSSSATVHSIHITDGGKLVIKDDVQPIILRTRHILIENDGELHIGSELCPYQGNVAIILYGRADDGSQPDPYFGQKYLGVSKGGTLEIHGKKKLSWTFLNKTLHPGGMEEGGYYFERSWGHRGVIVHVIDPRTGAVVHSDRFDTYRAKEESVRLAQYLGRVANGMILSVAVNDEGSRNLDDLARKAMTKLGSKHFLHLGFRHPWSFITIKGNPSSSVEDHIEYQGHKGSAVAKVFKLFKAENGEHFNVSSTSEWVQDVEWTEWFEKPDKARSKDMEKLSDFKAAHPDKICRQPVDIQAMTLDGADLTTEVFYKGGHDYQFLCHGKDQTGEGCHNYRVRFLCGKSVKPKLTVTVDTNVNSTILNLVDDVSSWSPGDRLVVASTDYSMYQAEEFQVLPCRTCKPTQVKVAGKATYLHMGEVVDGVDMRAEVGLLSRNVLVMGEMEQQCYEYSSKLCSFFDFDTFGGHIKIGLDFKATHIEGLELKYMGQQTMGHYPIHFHMAGDVDEKGGYNPPTYVKDTSIHHTFSRCVTVHGSNGLLETGFWFVLHHVPTGPSAGMYSPGYSEHMPMGKFSNNRAHSNYRAGMIIDNGVKTTPASAKDKRPILTLISGRYSPHKDADPLKPREPAIIEGFIAYKNQDHGAWLRGGDVWLDNCQDFPIRGIQFYDGPINVQNCTFRKLAHRSRKVLTSAKYDGKGKIPLKVLITSRVFFGEPGPWFNDLDMDGDKTSVFHDVDGSVSEYPGSYLIKEDNWLIKHPDCIDVPDWRGSICSGHFAQIYIQAYKPANLKMKIIKNDYHNHPLYLEGALSKSTHYQQYQPVVTLRKGYTIHWDKTAPEELAIWLINFNKNDWIQVGFCYPKGTTFSILSDIHNRLLKKTYKTGTFYRSSQMEKLEHRYPTKGYYYWDEDTGLLFLKLKAQNEKEKFAFCSVKGCERIRIKAVIPKTAGVSDCEATAYPKYIETPIVEVPMPKKLSSAQLKTKDHLIEVKIETYKKQYFHLRDDFAYIEVDGVRFFLTEEGIQLVVIDGHHGKVVDRVTFKNSILQGIPAQIENYVNNIKDHSIVLVTSKGRFISRGPWTKVLEKLGAGEGFRLKEKMAFVGFKGGFRPVWVRLATSEDSAKIYQALPIPVVKKMKL